MATERLTFEMNAVGNAVPQMQKVQQQLGNVNRQMTQTTQVMQRHTRATQRVVRSNMGMTRGLGLASLQFQDMAVQASMGTDALRIMTMQGPQLASIFGPKGMIIGGLIAVGGAIAMMSRSAKSLSFDFKGFFNTIKPAFEGLMPIIDAFKDAFRFLGDVFIKGVNAIINANLVLASVVGTVFTRIKSNMERVGVVIEIAVKKIKKLIQSTIDLANVARGKDPKMRRGAIFNGVREDLTEVDALASEIAALQLELDALTAKRPTTGLLEQIGIDIDKLPTVDIMNFFKMVDKVDKDVKEKIAKRTQAVADTIKSSLEDGFMSIVDGTKSVKDAFRSMARDIIAHLYKVLVVQRLVGSFDAATGTGTGIVGAIMNSIPIPQNAMGGPVTGGRATIVGERGPEILVPHRSGHIIPNNKLGGQGLVINQYNNFQEGVSRSEIQSMLPKIVEASKSAVLDARRRGGSYAAAFG